MNIEILHLIEGAKQADGLVVIIDVFRAFSMECYLYAFGAKEVRPVGSIEETFAWRQKDSHCILAGERYGKRIEGCEQKNRRLRTGQLTLLDRSRDNPGKTDYSHDKRRDTGNCQCGTRR